MNTPINNEVYYDTNLKLFRTIRGFEESNYIMSDGTHYYNDAITTTCWEILSKEYFDKFIIPVGAIDKFKFAVLCYRSKSWKVNPKINKLKFV